MSGYCYYHTGLSLIRRLPSLSLLDIFHSGREFLSYNLTRGGVRHHWKSLESGVFSYQIVLMGPHQV